MIQEDRIPETAIEWLEQGRKVALATVIRTWGSAPRRIGAQLVVDQAAVFEGSVSGGCVEGAVITEAIESIDDGRCRVLNFGVADETAFEVGLACGGDIDVMVEPVGVGQGIAVKDLQALVEMRRARKPVLLETDTRTWERRLVPPQPSDVAQYKLFRMDTSQREGDIFRAVHNPPLRMVIVGAVHIAQPLMTMARLAGFDVSISDPREGFASSARFPDATFLEGWSDEALRAFAPDTRTAVVALTHDPKIDTPALEQALQTDAFYIGALGSKRTHAKRVSALRSAGVSEDQVARIHGPVGLDIGAATPAEIAVSIMAEIVERLRRTESRSGT